MLSFLQLDFLSLDCARGETNFYARVLVVTLTPICIAFVIGLAMWARLLVAASHATKRAAQADGTESVRLSLVRVFRESVERRRRALSRAFRRRSAEEPRSIRDSTDFRFGEEKEEKMKALAKREEETIKAQHAYAFLLLSYLVLPPVSMMQFQSLDCIILEQTDGSRYLKADTAIDCDSTQYELFEVYVALSIFAYQTIPLVWLYVLWKYRKRLNPPRVPLGVALRERALDKDLAVLSFLWADYAPSMWFYEVLEMCKLYGCSLIHRYCIACLSVSRLFSTGKLYLLCRS